MIVVFVAQTWLRSQVRALEVEKSDMSFGMSGLSSEMEVDHEGCLIRT
jgi:hypothetical protein